MRLLARIWCLLVLVVVTGVVAAQEPAPRELLEKAITAHGGKEALVPLQISITQLKGTIHAPEGDLAISGEVAHDGSKRQRVAVQLEINGMRFEIITAWAGEKGWIKFGDMVLDMDDDKVAEAREEAHANYVATLVPLLEAEFKLASRGEVKVGERPAWGLIVAKADRRDVQLFFDKETHLLVKTEQRVKDDAGREVTEEAILSDHEPKGARQARKVAVRRDDKPYLDIEVTSNDPEDKLDDKLFERP